MSEQPKFEKGDQVKLKSGGPDMTVKEKETDYSGKWTGYYICQWFAGKKLESGKFTPESLEQLNTDSE